MAQANQPNKASKMWAYVALSAILVIFVGCRTADSDPSDERALPPEAVKIDELLERAMVVQVNDPEQSEALLTETLEIIAAHPDPVREVRVRSKLSRVLFILGDWERAKREAEMAYNLAVGLDAPAEIADAAYSLGAAYFHSSEYARVLELAAQSRKQADRAHDPTRVVQALSMMGVTYRNLGEYPNALASLLEAAAIQEPLGQTRERSLILNNLGLVYWNIGDEENALKAFEEVLAIQRKAGAPRLEAMALNNIGLILQSQSDLEGAHDHFDQARKIKEEMGERATLASTLNNLGITCRALGHEQEGLAYLKRSLELRRESGDRRGTAKSLLSLGQALLDSNQIKRARQLADEALKTAIEIDAKSEISEAFSLQAKIAEASGDLSTALDFYKKFHDMDHALIEPEAFKQVIDMSTDFATTAKEREIAQLRQDTQIAELKLERERILRYSALAVVVFLIVLLISVWHQSRVRVRMNRLLEATNRRLLESESQYRLLFHDPATPKVVVTLRDLRIFDANTSFARLVGTSREALLGAKADEVDVPWLTEVVMQPEREASGGHQDSQIIWPDHMGDDHHLELWSSHLELPEGPSRLITVRDITERRRLEEESERSRKLEAVGVLAGGIAHDFNNAMAAVLGRISLARFQLDEPQVALKELEAAETCILETRELTGRLIAFSPGGVPRRRTTDLADLVRETVSNTLDDRGIDVQLDIATDLPLVEIDAAQIRQAVKNLLINAIEASRPGGQVAVRVLTAGRSAPMVRIEIADGGSGISETIRDRIFEPFFTTKEGSPGLGLTASHVIVSQHKGRLTYDVNASGGTLFVMELPAAVTRTVFEEATALPQDEAQARVLAIEDDVEVQQVYRDALTVFGYQVDLVMDGSSALELYRRALQRGHPYQVVIVDLSLPGGKNGKDVFLELKALDPNVSAIVASGYSDDPTLANHREIGFVCALKKPFRLEDLKDALKRAQTNGNAPSTPV